MAKAKDTAKRKPSEADYQIILSPVITEKATMGSQYAQVTFKVALGASKPEIKRAVEALFDVKVKAVNTAIAKGKTKRFRGIKSFRTDVKKAIVTLEPGQTIDTGVGV